MPFVQLLVFAILNLILLPYTAHKTGYRWWAYLIQGVILGAVLALFTSSLGGLNGWNTDQIWIAFDVVVVLLLCLRLALTRRQYY